MTTRPNIAWPLALGIAGGAQFHKDRLGVPQELVLREQLRAAARRAGPLAMEFSRLPGRAAGKSEVVDQSEWARLAAEMVEGLLDRIWPNPQPPGMLRRIAGLGSGAGAGLVLRLVGRGLLGQYDPLEDRLVLLAPTLDQYRIRHGFVAEDFYLWVAIHEQTHAVQFNSAPWLLPLLVELFRELVEDKVSLADGCRLARAGGGATALLMSPAGRATLDRLVALMTLLEGHADFVSDAVGPRHLPTVRSLRRAFERQSTTGFARLLPGLDKAAQYRDGLAFCRRVVLMGGREALNLPFSDPDQLPNLTEVRDPDAWLRRVHG